MNGGTLRENFEGPAPAPELRWWNEPPGVRLGPDGLTLETAPATDFWQGTHYGFRVDNGHLLSMERVDDFVMSTEVHLAAVNQYDQAGLMVRVSPVCWLKTSIEWEPHGPSRLGAVVTNAGWSDWSTQDVPSGRRAVALRVTRTGADYLVEAADPTSSPGRWSQLRIARLVDSAGGSPVQCGLYACSPKAAGFVATFRHLCIEPSS